MSKEQLLMTIITAHHLFLCHCVNSSVFVLDPRYFSSGAVLPQKNNLGPKQSPPNSHNDLQKDGA